MQIIKELITQAIGNKYIEAVVIDGVYVDFWVPTQNKAIILFEEEHDHPDAYFGRDYSRTKLKEQGKEVLLLWIEDTSSEWVKANCTDLIAEFFHV